MTARWEDVMDAQLDLSIALATRGSDSRLGTEGFARALTEDGTYRSGPGALTSGLADRLSTMAFNADPVYVDADMMTIWEASIEGFQPEPLARTDLVTPAGFLLLPRARYAPDTHGKAMSWRALLWHPQEIIIHGGADVPVTAVRPGEVHPGGARLPVERVGGSDGDLFRSSGLLVSLWHDARDRDDYDDVVVKRFGREPRGLLVTHVMPWGWGEDWGEDGAAKMGSLMRPLQSLWRLMLQTIAQTESARAPSPFRRRWERQGWPEKRVTVVRLRRPRQDRERDEPGRVEWSHRWIVGSHWRWQWYPTQDARVCGHRTADGLTCDKAGGVHRQIFISPFVKGPPELELVVPKARVFELVR